MRNALLAISLIAVFAFFLYVAVNPGDFGGNTGDHLIFGEPKYSDMDDYFIHNGQNQTGANNIVTSIVFDYRGFDTLGEASVLFTAVLGVGVALRLLRRDKNDE
ncbi:MAG: hydrogenase [Thermotogae bacterium]|nr:MAG: hydrogenase [Thermotogota bacterium]